MQIDPDSREEKQALSFLSALAEEGGYKLRPPSYLTVQNVKLLDLGFGKSEGEGSVTDLDADERQDQVNVYLFIQAAPGPDVERALRAYRKALRTKSREEAWEDFICNAIAPFLGTLTPSAKASLEAQLETMDEADAAIVRGEPPRGQREERPDPNG